MLDMQHLYDDAEKREWPLSGDFIVIFRSSDPFLEVRHSDVVWEPGLAVGFGDGG